MRKLIDRMIPDRRRAAPCPFCGERDVIIRTYLETRDGLWYTYAECDTCGRRRGAICTTEQPSLEGKAARLAMAAWNSRVRKRQ